MISLYLQRRPNAVGNALSASAALCLQQYKEGKKKKKFFEGLEKLLNSFEILPVMVYATPYIQ